MSIETFNEETGIQLIRYVKARFRSDQYPPNRIIDKVEVLLDALTKIYTLSSNTREQIIIENHVQNNFISIFFRNWILREKPDIRDEIVTDSVGKHKRGDTKPTKKEYFDFYAVYAGFAGMKGFENDVSLFDCFEMTKHLQLLTDKDIKRRLVPPTINYPNADILVMEYQAKKDFYHHYSGYFNVFFIDETTVRKKNQHLPLRFEVANFEFRKQTGKFYYQELKTKKLRSNLLFPLPNSPKSNFYVQEIDSDWAYMFSFERPKQEGKIMSEFPVFQLGSTQEGYKSFAGIGYAVRVEHPMELILPARNLKTLNSEKLRLHSPITSVQFNDAAQSEKGGKKVYKTILENGEPLDQKTIEKLQEMEEKLFAKKNLF